MHPFDATLTHLREQFIAGAQRRVRRMGTVVDRLASRVDDATALEELRDHAHRLAGAAATYGYPGLAQYGSTIEAAVLGLQTAQRSPSPQDLKRWRQIVSTVRLEFGRAQSGIVAPIASQDLEPSGTVLLVMSWGPLRERLGRILRAQGLQVRTASDRATARRALKKQTPDALVVDLSVQGGTVMQVVDTLRQSAGGDAACVLFLATEGDFQDRLDAVQAGADGVLEGEVLPERVSAEIQALLRRKTSDLGHILYLEGDPDQAAYVERLLRAAGYQVTVCIDPSHFADTVSAVAPDLVLMETVLTGARGVDVARALRQEPRFRGLPLLFLTTDSSIATGTGDADGWLKKPVDPRLLLSTVENHLQRARMRAETRALDSLTQLPHHAAFERQLNQWMTAGDPTRLPSALIVVDMDVTAELNARFGHALCDELLRTLGNVLSAELTSVQLCGRYDGDAFALLILDRTEADIKTELSDLRAGFAGIERYAPDGRVFHANFSAGIARYQAGWRRPQVWLAATEDAVREAKKKGGGRVMVASTSARRALNVPRLR